MSIKYTDLTLLALVCTLANVNAIAGTSAGLSLNADGPRVHYNRSLIDYPQAWTKPLGLHHQHLSILLSQESSHRNLLISGALALVKYGKTFGNNHSINPRVYLFLADLFKTTTVAAAAGATYLVPARQYTWLHFDLKTEVFLAPSVLTRGEIDYLWGADLQATYPLPQNNELSFGYRKIETSLNHRPDTIEQGLYIGLTTYF